MKILSRSLQIDLFYFFCHALTNAIGEAESAVVGAVERRSSVEDQNHFGVFFRDQQSLRSFTTNWKKANVVGLLHNLWQINYMTFYCEIFRSANCDLNSLFKKFFQIHFHERHSLNRTKGIATRVFHIFGKYKI